MLVKLETCKIKDRKIQCELADEFHQDKISIPSRDIGTVKVDDTEFEVEASPYWSGTVGISIPISPAPGSPTINFDTGPDLPWTVLPIPKKIIDRIGDKWLPSPVELGPEDKYELPPTPKQLFDELE